MSLEDQVLSIIFSISYGILMSYAYNINYKFLYKTDILYKILINFLFVTNLIIIYFICLIKINNGIIHIYMFILSTFFFIAFNNKLNSIKGLLNLKNKVNVKLLKDNCKIKK